MTELQAFKHEMLVQLINIKIKIMNNSIHAWEPDLENTKFVTILEDFNVVIDETGEDETVKYNGWDEDLDRLIASLK